MERTAGLFQKIVTNAPFSEIAPDAQLKAGAAREKQKKYPEAVDAYERAADRYHDREQIASEALFRAGNAWNKQAKTSEYDQGAAGHAISTYTDFMTLYPDDKRVNEAANAISSLRTEQARGNFEIAKFYEKHNKWNGALIYYNEVLVRDPNSPYAPKARERIDAIKKRVQDKAG
jgi:outer membrane protein assembly factor BamD